MSSGVGSPASCEGTPLVTFITLLVNVVNRGLQAERERAAARARVEAARARDADEEFDYVVVGGGSAGCVLAARLSERADLRVLLLERGGTEQREARVPGLLIANLRTLNAEPLKALEDPQNCNGTGCQLQIPNVLGGGSTINGMMYVRGSDADFDLWAEQTGDPAWSYSNVLQYFKKAEHNSDIAIAWDKQYHSDSGPQRVSWMPVRHPVTRRLSQAYDEIGDPFLLDINGEGQLGHTVVQTTAYNGERWSTYRSYLQPALQRFRPNLRVLTFAKVRRVLFSQDGDQPYARGVEFLDAAGQVRQVRAAREVVLTAGALHTPQVLILSGIGPAQQLQELGIPVLADLPVGEGLMDHPRLVGMEYKCPSPLCQVDWGRREEDLKQYASCRHRGQLAANGPLQFTSFHRTRVQTGPGHQPDLQMLYLGAVEINGTRCTEFDTWRFNRIVVMPTVLHPESRGWVRVNASDPYGPPLVRLNYFGDEEGRDLAVIKEGLRIGMQLEKPLAKLGLELDHSPAPAAACRDLAFGSDEYLSCVARVSTATLWHWAGTCRMGRQNDPAAVVDSKLRVRGVRRLRVADASIMPSLTSGNTNSPTIMIAEHAADIILQDSGNKERP